MSHVVVERLVGRALGEADVLSVADLTHLDTCRGCRQIADELRAVVRLNSDLSSAAYEVPPDPGIWLAIQARLGSVEQLPAPGPPRVSRPAAPRVLRPAAQRVFRPAAQRVFRPAARRVLRPAAQRVLRPAALRLVPWARRVVAQRPG